jgi:hypothetical protein
MPTVPPSVSTLLTTAIPERLWHYTSFAGFRGITESQTIFASDGRFLNDMEELVHARQILEELAEQEIENIQGSSEWKDTNLPPVIAKTLRETVGSLFGGPFSAEFL